ncbi:MAG: 16S rRNA (cytidine1402-2'-O)-methyltransferase [Rhodothermales bacterium]|jgi:16S rRNA (cytidine1402-2'-O)-methyltransferase
MPEPTSPGWLALVSSPIGNLEDMTFRGVRILGEADIVAAEDTRRARKLLSHFELRPARLVSYHMHNERRKTGGLLEQVRRGQRVAVLCDAGTPSIADPGFLLVREAIADGIEPTVIPGVSALSFAITACGFPVTECCFAGFLPPKGEKRRKRLVALAERSPTLILFESPYRINRLLEDIAAALPEATQVAMMREVTKLHEETLRGTASELLERTRERNWKGEFTVAIHRIE